MWVGVSSLKSEEMDKTQVLRLVLAGGGGDPPVGGV